MTSPASCPRPSPSRSRRCNKISTQKFNELRSLFLSTHCAAKKFTRGGRNEVEFSLFSLWTTGKKPQPPPPPLAAAAARALAPFSAATVAVPAAAQAAALLAEAAASSAPASRSAAARRRSAKMRSRFAAALGTRTTFALTASYGADDAPIRAYTATNALSARTNSAQTAPEEWARAAPASTSAFAAVRWLLSKR